MRRKTVFASLFVLVLILGMVAGSAINQTETFENTTKKCEKCIKGDVIETYRLKGIKKETLIKKLQATISSNPTLSKIFERAEFSKAVVVEGLIRSEDGKLIRRTVVIVPLNESAIAGYIKNTEIKDGRIKQLEIPISEEVKILELNENKLTITRDVTISNNRIHPNSVTTGCTDIPCTSDADCPTDHPDPLCYYSGCDCDKCVELDDHCVATVGILTAACYESCNLCLGGSPEACVACVACVILYEPAVVETCCERWQSYCEETCTIIGP